MNKNTKTIIHNIAAYQIFGGVLGIGLAIKIIPQLKEFSQVSLGMVLFAVLFYLFSLVSGIILFKKKKLGLTLSLVNQVLQVVSFAIGEFAYNYVAGFKIGFGIDFAPIWQLKLNLSLPSFQFFLNTETGKVYIGINLFALFLVYLLERLREK